MHIKIIFLISIQVFFLAQFVTAQKKLNKNDSTYFAEKPTAPAILYWDASGKEHGAPPAAISNMQQQNITPQQRVNDSAQHVPILKTDSIEFLPGTTRKASKINPLADKTPPNSPPLLIYDNKFR